MDTSKWANWLQIGGNIGIIAGLVLVAVQINQSSAIAQLDMRSRSFELAMQGNAAMMGENPAAAWAKASLGEESLSEEELTVLHNYLEFFWNLRERNSVMQNSGIFDTRNYSESVDYSGKYIFGGNEISRIWWTHLEPYNFDQWTEQVDRTLETSSDGFIDILDLMKSVQ